LKQSEDPFDNLEDFAQYIHDNIGSTGVYIGQLEPPRKEAADDADEDAHLDRDRPEIIKFKYANGDHKSLMVNTELSQGQGITHEVLTEEYTAHNQDVDPDDADGPDLLDSVKHIFVKEVVRDPKMHYWRVPRLGSYMAIPLVYRSALSVHSFKKAVTDLEEHTARQKAQDEERALWEMQQE